MNLVLDEIDASSVPQLLVYNKIDCLDEPPRIDYHSDGMPYRVWLSARDGLGLDLLCDAIGHCLYGPLVAREVVLKQTQAKLRNRLYRQQLVVHESVNEQGWVLQLKIREGLYSYFFGEAVG